MLLKRLRRVILQDSALMQQKYPNHFIFKHDLFETDLYKAYAKVVIDADNVTETPMDLQLQQAMPRMVERVDTARDAMIGGLSQLQSSFSVDIHSLSKCLEDFGEQLLEERLQDQKVLGKALGSIAAGISMMSQAVMETRMVFPGGGAGPSTVRGTHTTPPQVSRSPESPQCNTSLPTNPCTNSDHPDPLTPTRAPAGISEAARVFAELRQTGERGIALFDGNQTSAGSSGPTEKASTTAEFVLEKDHLTVSALWKEYDEGVFGRIPVRKMIKESLKKSESQRKRWERRRVVINEIERLSIERTTSTGAVVEALDRFMKRERLSMAKLQDRITKARGSSAELPLWG